MRLINNERLRLSRTTPFLSMVTHSTRYFQCPPDLPPCGKERGKFRKLFENDDDDDDPLFSVRKLEDLHSGEFNSFFSFFCFNGK